MFVFTRTLQTLMALGSEQLTRIAARTSEWNPKCLTSPPRNKDYEVFWADGRALFYATQDEFSKWHGSQGSWEELVHVAPLKDPNFVPQRFGLPNHAMFLFYNDGKDIDQQAGVYDIWNPPTPEVRDRINSMVRAFRQELWSKQAQVVNPSTGRKAIFHLLPEDTQAGIVREWMANNAQNHPDAAYRDYQRYCTHDWACSVSGKQLPTPQYKQSFEIAAGVATVRIVYLFEIPHNIGQMMMGYVAPLWGNGEAKNIGFHWSLLHPESWTVRVRSVGGDILLNNTTPLDPDTISAFQLLRLDDVRILLTFKRMGKKKDKAVGDGLFSIQRGTLHNVVANLTINSSFPEFNRVKRIAVSEITSVLGHEFTHARQAVEGTFFPNVGSAEMQQFPLRYFLQEDEVEAHVREVVNNARTWGADFDHELHTYVGYLIQGKLGSALSDGDKQRLIAVYSEFYRAHYTGLEENTLIAGRA